jgi:hypothetical protein
MRLTVHVKDAKKIKEEVKGGVIKEKTMTTLTYNEVYTEDEANMILSEIESQGLGTPVKYTLVYDKGFGSPKKKKK